MARDCERLAMAEAISMMNDQLVGRVVLIRPSRCVRKQMLADFTGLSPARMRITPAPTAPRYAEKGKQALDAL